MKDRIQGPLKFGPALFFGMILVAIGGYAASGYTWAGWQVPDCYPACFCEAFQPGPIVQPQSSYSNLVIVMVGLMIMGAANASWKLDGEHNLFLRGKAYSLGYGAAVVVVGLTSLFYHISLTFAGQMLDYIGMYLFASFVALYELARLRWLRGKAFWGAWLALNAGLVISLLARPELRRYLFVGLVASLLVLEGLVFYARRPVHIRFEFLATAIAIFGVALATNLSDESGALCVRESWWQWHAFWHILVAAAMGLLYLYFRSEKVAQGELA